MQIEPRVIDEILNKTDIVDLIGRSLKLRKSGSSYFGCCPFHNEKTPSFSINPKEQFFHCFGCGESGDAITFVMRYYGYDFVESVKYLGRNCGVYVEETENKISFEEIKKLKQQKLTLQDTINKATQFYRTSLLNSAVALSYLNNRGLSNDIIQDFVIGYALNEYTGLSRIFVDYGTNQYLGSAGLVGKNSQGKVYDKFRHRIIFPIRNVRGEVVGFGGRVIDKSEPKYLNSPETELFNKSNELYGLYESQKAIRETKFVIVVEGYLDVIALHQFEVKNAVATMGTSVTEEHIKKLFRQADDIYFCFDGDNAGKKAGWRALERSIELVTELKIVHFVFLPEEHDPDSFIRQFGKNQFLAKVKSHSLTLSEFMLAELSSNVNIKTEEGKAKLIGLCKPYIEKFKTATLQVMLKKQLAGYVGLEPRVLESILNNRSRYAFYNSNSNRNDAKVALLPLKLNYIKLIIHNGIRNIDWVNNYNFPDKIDDLPDEIRDMVIFLDYISHNYTKSEAIDVSEIINSVSFVQLNIENILKSKNRVQLSQEEFIKLLDNILGINILKPNVNKIPKISLKNKS